MNITHPTLPATVYAQRRQALAQRVAAAGGGVVLVHAGQEQMRNRDADYPFRVDSYFYYLTGFPEPQACLVLVVPPAGHPRSILLCRAKHEEREIWDGFRFGPALAAPRFGLDEAHPEEDLEAVLSEQLGKHKAVWLRLGQEPLLEPVVARVMQSLRAKVRQGVAAPQALHDVSAILDELRLCKDEHEQATMRRAADITARAHQAAMRATAPGRYEYEIEAELLYQFRQGGAEAPAYGSIVAGGGNACVLHYRSNNDVLRAGDLLLIDAGCELDCYASDVTRTFPISGHFSKAQQAVYEVVLAAQAAAIAATRPGARFNDPHDAAVAVLTQGLVDLKLLQMPVEEALQSKAYSRFYMHRTSHWLGMDVHDCGSYRDPSELNCEAGSEANAQANSEVGSETNSEAKPPLSRPLLPGMVLTIEPGLYIRPGEGVPSQFENIGIRIEDDVLVQANGCEVYTAHIPKTVADIHAAMAGKP